MIFGGCCSISHLLSLPESLPEVLFDFSFAFYSGEPSGSHEAGRPSVTELNRNNLSIDA